MKGVKIGEIVGNAVDDRLGRDSTIYLDGNSAIRMTVHNVQIARGYMLKIVGMPDDDEPAPVDYISILPLGVQT